MSNRISRSRMERPPRSSSSSSNNNGHGGCFYDPPSSSFSSTLLDAIYRSIDEPRHLSPQSQSLQRGVAERKKQEPEVDFFPELTTLKKKMQQQISSGSYNNGGAKNGATSMMTKSSSAYLDREWKNRHAAAGSRARLVDRWMENPSAVEERGLSGGEGLQHRRSDRRFSLGSAESISSSSEDTEPFYHCAMGHTPEKKKSLKPIRTSISVPFLEVETLCPPKQRSGAGEEKPRGAKSRFPEQQRPAAGKGEGKATAKSKAMKFYGDLKRMKQPISPGGRLATFLNSLFSAASGGAGGSAKKQRISTSSASPAPAVGVERFVDSGRWDRESNSKSSLFSSVTTPSNCSTASSSRSRSCLSSKTTTSISSTGEKRSVRFCPVNVIIDEDPRPCGHKSLNKKNEGSGEKLRARVMEQNQRVEEAARDLLKNYHGNHKKLREIIDVVKEEEDEDEEDEEEEDGASCCSSDLFELENLLEIGHHHHEVDRYCEELPVYETPYVDTNRAIANGSIV